MTDTQTLRRRALAMQHTNQRELVSSAGDGYQATQHCVECEGVCCKKLPGCAHPEDLDNGDEATIRKALESGDWAIDWCGVDDLPFLRPATVNGEAIFDPSFGGTCVFLTQTGCALPFKEHPRGCRMLKPRAGESGSCRTEYGKPEAIRDWAPYKELLDRVGHEVLEVKNAEGR